MEMQEFIQIFISHEFPEVQSDELKQGLIRTATMFLNKRNIVQVSEVDVEIKNSLSEKLKAYQKKQLDQFLKSDSESDSKSNNYIYEFFDPKLQTSELTHKIRELEDEFLTNETELLKNELLEEKETEDGLKTIDRLPEALLIPLRESGEVELETQKIHIWQAQTNIKFNNLLDRYDLIENFIQDEFPYLTVDIKLRLIKITSDYLDNNTITLINNLPDKLKTRLKDFLCENLPPH